MGITDKEQEESDNEDTPLPEEREKVGILPKVIRNLILKRKHV